MRPPVAAPTGPLPERWAAVLGRFGVTAHEAEVRWRTVEAAYSRRHRRYHTLAHVTAVLDAAEALMATEPVEVPSAIRLAAFLHDVVYDPTRADNEELSARWVGTLVGRHGLPAPIATRAGDLVRLTAGHDVASWDLDGAVLVDADLSVLGAPADVYDAYVDGVRFEYRHVPDDAFRAGRAAVLEGFAGRSSLFRTGTGRARWEAAARANLGRELAALRG